MTYTQKELETKFVKSKIALAYSKSVFLTTIFFSLKHHFINTPEIPTAGTDGINLYINPDFFMNLTQEETIGLFLHEAWHIALMHPIRALGKDLKRYNKAGDYVINPLIIDLKMALPSGGLYDQKYRNWTTMEVYNDLETEDTDDNIGGYGFDIIPLDLLPDALKSNIPKNITPKILEKELQNRILTAKTQAEISSKNKGTFPAELQKLFDQLTNPIIPWEELVYNFMTEIVKDDYSWKRPNRRYLPNYLPSRYSEGLGKIVVAFDTSGSIRDADIIEFLTETQRIYDAFNPLELIILDCDTKIHNIHKINHNSDLNILDLKFTGGGGTSFKPVIEFCKKEDPVVLIYFTDLWATQVTEEQDYSILWICYDDKHTPAPIGETIYYTSYTN